MYTQLVFAMYLEQIYIYISSLTTNVRPTLAGLFDRSDFLESVNILSFVGPTNAVEPVASGAPRPQCSWWPHRRRSDCCDGTAL